MDALIALFIVIGIVNALGSSRKKREQRARQARARAFQQAQQAQSSPQPSHEDMLRQARRARARQEKREAEAHRARTPEELQAHLAAMDAEREREAWPSAAQPARADAPVPAKPQVVAPNHPAEGIFSTQGESAEEHAEHLRRAAAEEAANRIARETLRDLREARREKLRAAVIMSEILDKPVSLRARTGYHR